MTSIFESTAYLHKYVAKFSLFAKHNLWATFTILNWGKKVSHSKTKWFQTYRHIISGFSYKTQKSSL